MFSVTNTGTNFLPWCTANVSPTISGSTVERRDQVLITFFDLVRCASSTLLSKCLSINGPFLTERAICLTLLPAWADDELGGRLVLAGLVTLGGHSPWRARVPAARGATFAAAHWMIDGVHAD